MSEPRFLTFSVQASSGTQEVAINVGLLRFLRHRLGANDGDNSVLEAYFIDDPNPHVFSVTERVAMEVILRLREMKS